MLPALSLGNEFLAVLRKGPMTPRKSATIHCEILHDEICLYDWDRKEVHALNATAARIWQLCDGQTTVQEIASQLGSEFACRTPRHWSGWRWRTSTRKA